MNTMIITVCTPTYNRAHLLERAFKSLCGQTNKLFKWLIIDDGSVDDTERVVQRFQGIADFEIIYRKKENGGRHTALNYSYQFIDTPYVINLDSDDELTPDAIELIYNAYYSIPKEEYERFWLISGRCIDSKTKKIVGKPYPKKINYLKGKQQRRALAKCGGEKSNCRRVDVLRRFPFPTFDDTKFVTENIIWEKINKEYDSYCVNDVFRVYYQDSVDSLAKGKVHSQTRMKSRFYYSLFCINDLFEEITYNKNVYISIVNIARAALCSQLKYQEVMKSLNKWYKKLIVTVIGYPIAYFYVSIKREKVGRE